MYKCLHEFFSKTVPGNSLHEICDLIQAINILDVETTFMLTTVKKLTLQQEKKTMQHQGRWQSEQYVVGAFMPVFWLLTMEILQGVIPCVTNQEVRVCRTPHEDAFYM